MSGIEEKIERFLAAPRFAVVGASTNREKYGNKVLRCYQQRGLEVVPVNPRATEIEGLPCASSLGALESHDHAISVITPPAITLKIVEEAANLGHERVWMQPGAESAEVDARAESLGLEYIHGGPCLLVVLGFRN